MSIKHNYLSVISQDDMKKFIEETFKIDVDCVEPMLDEEVGKMFVCMSTQNLIEYTGEDSNWCVFGDLGIVKKDLTDDSYVNNFRFAELKPHLFKKYVLFVANQNMVDGEPIRIDGLTYGDRVVRALADYIGSKPKNKFGNLFNKNNIVKADLTDLLVQVDRELNALENSCEEPAQ